MKKREVLVSIFIIVILSVSIYIYGSYNQNLYITGFFSFNDFFSGPFFEGASLGKLLIDIEQPFIINIYSPENSTYNFSINSSYNLWLNVTSNRNISDWYYSLRDLKHNILIVNMSVFIPNQTISAVRWSNELIVYGFNDLDQEKNATVQFFIYVNNSSPIIGNLSNQYVCEKNFFNYYFNVTDVDEDMISATLNPQYPYSPFYIRYESNSNLVTSIFRIYSGRINKNDLGGINNGSWTWREIVSASDNNLSDWRAVNITVIEINNPPLINPIGVHTIWNRGENSSFYYQVYANDTEDGNSSQGNLSFNINFFGIKLFNISGHGIMNYSFNQSNITGTYNISVCVVDRGLIRPYPNITYYCLQDGLNISTCNNFSLVITDQNRPPKIISFYPNTTNVNESADEVLYFNITKYDPDGPALDTFWYVDSNLVETDYYNPNSSNFNEFYYKFGCGNSGLHSVKSVVSDGELNDSVSWNISVIFVSCPPGIVPPPAGGGGGGGGPSKIISCNESWGCEEWGDCINLKNAFESRNITKEINYNINQLCKDNEWGDEICGYQVRNCTELNKCWTNLSKPGTYEECYYSPNPSCYDNIKNCHDHSCEVQVDCGGPCLACPSCSDKIKNQGEEDVDCGGPCPSCKKEQPVTFESKTLFIYPFLLLVLILLLIVIILIVNYYKTRIEVDKLSRKKDFNYPDQSI